MKTNGNYNFEVFNLAPVGSQKSFNGKAIVIKETKNGVDVFSLKSYNTIVATYNSVTGELKINGYYSSTTNKHLNSFLNYIGKKSNYVGKKSMNKKEVLEYVKNNN